MLTSRKSKAKKNIVVSLGSQVVVLLCGIIVPRAMLGAFGSEAYGATTSIAQFLSYITLLEGGIGGVARAALYGPIASADNDMIGAIMSEIKRFFSILAWIFVFYVFCLACGFQSLSHVTCMDWLSSFLLVLVISVSTVGQYFIGITYSIFLQADQKSYITNGVATITTIIHTLSTVCLISAGCSMIVVKLVSSCIFFARPVVFWLYVKKEYAFRLTKCKGKGKYLKQKWSGLGQHIAYFLHSNTDVVVLTVLADLRLVAVYSVYHMVISHIKSFALACTSGMEALFGDMLARKENAQLKQTFRVYETMISTVAGTLLATTAILIVPFVKIYTSGIEDANYIVPVFAFIFVLSEWIYCLRSPYHSLVIAAGHFKQTSMAAYMEAVINVILSVVLVAKFGVIGVAIGTLLATAFRFVYYVLYLRTHIAELAVYAFVKRMLVNILAFALSCIVGLWIISFVEINNYAYWCLCGVVVFLTTSIITLTINYLFDKKGCSVLLKKVMSKAK